MCSAALSIQTNCSQGLTRPDRQANADGISALPLGYPFPGYVTNRFLKLYQAVELRCFSRLVIYIQVFLFFPKMPIYSIYPPLFGVSPSSLHMADGTLLLGCIFSILIGFILKCDHFSSTFTSRVQNLCEKNSGPSLGKANFGKILFIFPLSWMGVLPTSVCMQCSWKPSVGCPGTEIANGCEPPRKSWELNQVLYKSSRSS